MPRNNRAEKDMRDFAEEHLNYEFRMLISTADVLAKGGLDQMAINAILESFTIHIRALVDFLWEPGKPRPDDAVASDFFESRDEWLKLQPTFPKILEPVRFRTGKEIAHLTYARMDVTPESKAWNFVEMTRAVVSVLRVFANSANKKYLGDSLSDLIAKNG